MRAQTYTSLETNYLPVLLENIEWKKLQGCKGLIRGRKTREIALQNSNQKTRLVAFFSNKLANCNEMAVLKGVTSSSFFHHRGYSSLACATLESFYCFCFYYLKC